MFSPSMDFHHMLPPTEAQSSYCPFSGPSPYRNFTSPLDTIWRVTDKLNAPTRPSSSIYRSIVTTSRTTGLNSYPSQNSLTTMPLTPLLALLCSLPIKATTQTSLYIWRPGLTLSMRFCCQPQWTPSPAQEDCLGNTNSILSIRQQTLNSVPRLHHWGQGICQVWPHLHH